MTNTTLTKREQFMADNPDMNFVEMAIQLNTSLSAIERTYDRLQVKRKILALREHRKTHPVASNLDLAIRFGLSIAQVRREFAPATPTVNNLLDRAVNHLRSLQRKG